VRSGRGCARAGARDFQLHGMQHRVPTVKLRGHRRWSRQDAWAGEQQLGGCSIMAIEVRRCSEPQPAVGPFNTGSGHSSVRSACSIAVVDVQVDICQCGEEIDGRGTRPPTRSEHWRLTASKGACHRRCAAL
jgi:hypothetical protein